MNRKVIALIFLAISVLSFIFYYTQKLPSDIEQKGRSDFIREIISLTISAVSLLTALVNLYASRKKSISELHQNISGSTIVKPTIQENDSENLKSKNANIIKILFLAANPRDSSQLRLDEEMRGIDQALRQAEFRDKFDIKQQWAVRVVDLQGYLLRHKPDIVHFSGHGSVSSEIILEDIKGNSQPVPGRALSHLFSVLKDNIRCVVLNACYSEQQANAISKRIDCVVGMSKAIGDEAAINFAVAFYQALGYGRDVKTAFELGCGLIDLQGLNEQETPKLLTIHSKPEEIVFV